MTSDHFLTESLSEPAVNSEFAEVSASRSETVEPPSLRRRILGWSIDYVLAIVVMIVCAVIGTTILVHGLAGYAGAVAADAGWNAIKLAFHGGHGLGHELGTAAGGEWVGLVLPFILILLVAPLFQFIYQAGLLSWRGRTFGKMITDIRVRSEQTGSRPTVGHAMARAAMTTASETGLFSIACVLLVLGHLYTAVGVWLLAVVLFWGNALSGISGRRRTLADRLAGTTVTRTKVFATVAQQSVAAARTVTEVAGTVGGVARYTVTQVVESDLARRASSTRTAQQVKSTAAAATRQAKVLGANGLDRGRILSDRVRGAWREQRDQRRDSHAAGTQAGGVPDPVESED